MRRTFLFFAVVLLLAATGVFAQTSTTATIRGTVTNDAGAPVANAEINAVDASSGFVRTVNSRSDGTYSLAGLAPGTYNIVVAAPSFQPTSETLTVLVGQSLEQNIHMSTTPSLKETITVVGTQAVETRTSEIATNVTTHQIENLPQDDRNFLNFAALAPGIRLSTDPQRKTFAGDAQDPEQTNIFIDGVSTKNDILQGGTVGQDSSRGNPFPQSAVQEFRVITQNYSAQYDHASSAIITAVTKSGGNDFNGQAFTYYQPKQWVAATKKNFKYSTLTSNTSYHRTQPGISFGGPIVKDQLHFFATYEGDDEQAAAPVKILERHAALYGSQFSQFTGAFDKPFKSNLAFGKLSWQAAKNQVVDISGNYRRERETRDFGDQTSFESATDYRNWVYGATLRDQWNNNNALNEATVSLQTFGWNPQPLNPDLVGKLYFANGFDTIIRTGSNSTLQKFEQRRLELRDNYNFGALEMHGTHNFQIGGNVDFMHYNVDKSLNGIPLYKFIDDTSSGKFGTPFEVDYGIGNPILKISNNEYGIYGQDTWTVNPKLTLNLGLRWDYESHMLDENFVTPANIVTALKGKTFQFDSPPRAISIPDEYFSTGNERKPYKNEFQPRLGFAYDLNGDGKSVIFGGWGRYYDRLFLNSTLDERFRQQFPVYRFAFFNCVAGVDCSTAPGHPHSGQIAWNDSYFTPAGLQGLIAQGQTHPEVYLLSNNTKPPYSNQYNVGFRHAFGNWLGSASYNAVRASRGITYVAASGTCCGAFIPGYNAVIINDPAGKSFWYDGESITLDRPYTGGSHAWGAHFTYTHAKAQQNGNDLFSLDLPSAADYARHPVPGSEPNHFNATGIIGIPWDMRFSTSITLGTGGAAPITDFSQGFSFAGRLATGVKNGAKYPKGGYRNVDFRLQKDIQTFGSTSVTLIGEVFNAFNYGNYGCLNDFLGPPPDNGSDPTNSKNLASLGIANCTVSLGRREQVGLRINF